MKHAELYIVIISSARMEVYYEVGILTSGGDCQALNAAMRGVAKSLYNKIPDVRYMVFLMDIRDLLIMTISL